MEVSYSMQSLQYIFDIYKCIFNAALQLPLQIALKLNSN